MTSILVITVAFNPAATIGDTCESIATQTHGDVQHGVVDGASRGGTAAVAVVSDGLRHCNLCFPLLTYHLNNTTSDNSINVEPTLELCGTGPYAIGDAVERTVAWWRTQACSVLASR